MNNRLLKSPSGDGAGATSVRRRRPHLRWLPLQVFGGAALSVLLGWLIAQGLELDQVLGDLRDFPLYFFALALGAFLLALLLRAWRWWVLFLGSPVGLRRLFLIQNAGVGLNNVSPVRVFGEAVELVLLSRQPGVSASLALATLATDHLMDLLVTAGVLGVALFTVPELRRLSLPVGAGVLLAAASVAALALLATGIPVLPGLRRLGFLRGALAGIRTLNASRLRLGLSFLGTLAYWGMLGLSGWFVGQGLGIEMEAAALVALLAGSLFFVSAVPSLPGGAVTFEIAVIYTLGLFDVPRGSALVFALVTHIIMFLPSTVIAGLVLPREGIKLFGRWRSVLSSANGPNAGPRPS
ncbi:MAG: flippase-like domain-containing protein [Chloroflexi bacterium]|nr:flippase-like domain-containing protein [Chloroflexota bacterium]